MIKIGQHVEDRITKFKGIVTGRSEYITGCAQVLVQPSCKEDGDFMDGRWFDETRVIVTGGTTDFENQTPYSGPDQPAPKK